MAKGKKYTKEFKDSAIQLALNSEDSVRKIAKDLEIHEKTLYGWLNDYRKKHNLEVLNPTSKKSGSIKSIVNCPPLSRPVSLKFLYPFIKLLLVMKFGDFYFCYLTN